MRIRVLPVTMAVAALMLTLRAADLWQYAGAAFAQPSKPAAAPNPPPAAAPAPEPAPTDAPAAATATPAKAAAPAATAAPAPEAATTNIPEYSEAELAVLQELANRRQALDQRATDIERREALLKAAEQRIEAKVQELKQLQTSMEAIIRRYDEEEEARKKSLVKIFETMKPAEAARIFEQMDMPVLVDLIDRMKERSAAPVLAQMHPARARQVTAELARRRQPGPIAGSAPNG